MTELEMRVDRYLQQVDRQQPLTEEELLLVEHAFVAGFLSCREMATEELSYIGPHFLARDLDLGNFLQRRFIAVAALGDTEVERLYGPDREPGPPIGS